MLHCPCCFANSRDFSGLSQLYSSQPRYSVVQGEVDVAVAFAELPFDHLLFTGSTQVGKQVMQAAAKNLTPFTLKQTINAYR